MSGRVSAGENGLQSEHDNTGFNKASGRNKKGVSLGSSQGLLGKRRVTLFASFQRMNYFVSDILIFPRHHLKSEMTEEPVLQKKFKNDTFLM